MEDYLLEVVRTVKYTHHLLLVMKSLNALDLLDDDGLNAFAGQDQWNFLKFNIQ